MKMVFESAHRRRLQQYGIRIVTEYYDGGATRRRSSDGFLCEDVNSGVILDKTYEREGRIILRETEFNPGIIYSFVMPEMPNGQLKCPNCGAVSDRSDFSEGCPYCGAPGNLEYAEKRAGQRDHADYVLHRSARSFLWLCLCILIGVGIGLPLTLLMSRTAFAMDYVKGAAVGLFLGLGLFLLHQFIQNRIDIHRDELTKQRLQDSVLRSFLTDLEKVGLSLKTFHNGLSAELDRYFYGAQDPVYSSVVDYDILDFSSQRIEEAAGTRQILAEVRLRLVSMDDDRLSSDLGWWLVQLKQTDGTASPRLHSGFNLIDCPHCGAKLDVEKTHCPYCGSPTAYTPPLRLLSIRRIKSDRQDD